MANQASIKHFNGRQILDLLRVRGRTTRADLARTLGLTRSAVTYQVDDLEKRGLVREDYGGGRSKTDIGRPGIGVVLNPEGGHFLGVEIGVGLMRLALVDLALKTKSEETLAFDRSLEPRRLAQLIKERVDAFSASSPTKIRGLGLTLPGLVDKSGWVIHLPILGWREVDFATILDVELELPWTLSNNAKAAAFGHSYCFPEPRHSLMLFLKLGTGCGGAIVVEGRVLDGPSGLAGEFGHIRIAADGPVCSCGKVGCLETRVNLAALQRYVGANASPDQLSQQLADGDEAVGAAMATYVGHLAVGLGGLVNSFNPDSILLGGMLAPLLHDYLPAVRDGVGQNVVPGLPVPQVVLSRLGVFECAIGAAALAHQAALDNAEQEWPEMALPVSARHARLT